MAVPVWPTAQVGGAMRSGRVERQTETGWVYASECLSLTCLGKASQGKAKAKTGIGKSDLPGLQGGPRKRDSVSYDPVRAPRLYPDPEEPFP